MEGTLTKTTALVTMKYCKYGSYTLVSLEVLVVELLFDVALDVTFPEFGEFSVAFP